MWTPEGQTKSVHNSEVSTLVKLGVATGHISYILFVESPWAPCSDPTPLNRTLREEQGASTGVMTVDVLEMFTDLTLGF